MDLLVDNLISGAWGFGFAAVVCGVGRGRQWLGPLRAARRCLAPAGRPGGADDVGRGPCLTAKFAVTTDATKNLAGCTGS